MIKTEKVCKIDSRRIEKLEEILSDYFVQFCKVEVCYAMSRRSGELDRIVVYLYENKYDYLEVTMYDKAFGKSLVPNDVVLKVAYRLDDGFFIEHVASPIEVFMGELLEQYQCKRMYVNQGYLLSIDGDYVELREIESITVNNNEKIVTLMDIFYLKIIINLNLDRITYEEEDLGSKNREFFGIS